MIIKLKKIFEQLKEFIVTYDNNFNKYIIDNNKKVFNSYGIEKIKKLNEINGNEKLFILTEDNKKLGYEEKYLKDIYLILQNSLEGICNKLINNLDDFKSDNKETAKIAKLRMKIKEKFKIIYEELESDDETKINKYKYIYNYIFTKGENIDPFTINYKDIKRLLINIRNELRNTWDNTEKEREKIYNKHDSKLQHYIVSIRKNNKGNNLYDMKTELGKLWRNINRTKNVVLLDYYLCKMEIDNSKFTMDLE